MHLLYTILPTSHTELNMKKHAINQIRHLEINGPHFNNCFLVLIDVHRHTVTWETTNSAAQQWISTTKVYTLCRNTSSPCGLWPPVGPSVHSGNASLLGTPSPNFPVFVGSSSQTGSSSGFRKIESSVWERVELLSRRVMIPLLNDVLC